MSDAPEGIWLQVDHEHWYTWCQDKINDEDVEYIRKDIADKEKAEAIEYYHAIEEACDECLIEILQPIRYVMKLVKRDPIEGKAMLEDAIKESLKIADKLNKS